MRFDNRLLLGVSERNLRMDPANSPISRMMPTQIKVSVSKRVAPWLSSSLAQKPIPLGDHPLYIPGSVREALRIAEDNQAIQKVMHEYLQLGMTVIDVGANIGYLTLFAARKVGLQGKVFAVEPAKDNLVMLEKNVQLNQATNITVLACAAGRRQKTQDFYLHGSHSGHNSLFQRLGDTDVTETVSVKDHAFRRLNPRENGFCKIDVEGAELEVLAGMAGILCANPDIQLIIEWNPLIQQMAGYAPGQLPKFLIESGFELATIDRESERLGALNLEDIHTICSELTHNRSKYLAIGRSLCGAGKPSQTIDLTNGSEYFWLIHLSLWMVYHKTTPNMYCLRQNNRIVQSDMISTGITTMTAVVV